MPQHKLTLDSDRNYVLLSDNATRSYVARSGLQLDGQASRIAFTPERNEYRLGDDEEQISVDLTANVNGVDVIKRLTFERGSYAVNVSYYLANNTEAPVSARFIGQLPPIPRLKRATRRSISIRSKNVTSRIARPKADG